MNCMHQVSTLTNAVQTCIAPSAYGTASLHKETLPVLFDALNLHLKRAANSIIKHTNNGKIRFEQTDGATGKVVFIKRFKRF